jgi:uncharacterized protein YqeY
MSKEEIEAFVTKKKTELGITDKAQTIDLIKVVMPELKGKADGKLIKEVVDASFV